MVNAVVVVMPSSTLAGPTVREVFHASWRRAAGPHLGAMARILVTEKIADGGLQRLRDAGHVVDVRLGPDPRRARRGRAGPPR